MINEPYVKIEKITEAGKTVPLHGYTWVNGERALAAFRTAKSAFGVNLHHAAYVVNFHVGQIMMDSFWLEDKAYNELTRQWWSEALVFYGNQPSSR
jgi:hypothetical protein